jgi:hypothetical protein
MSKKKQTKKKQLVDITDDNGMAAALNKTWADFEADGDYTQGRMRTAILGRAISIRQQRFKEASHAQKAKARRAADK